MHAYYAWPRSLVLNCSDLNASNSDKFNLVSEVDGSKCSFTTHQLQTLITNLQTDLVLLPGGMVKDFAPSINYFVPYMEHKPGFGVYFVINDTNFSQMLGKVAEFSKEPKYIYADLSLDLYLQLCELPAIKIENSRFAVDAFQGDVYREGKVHSILDSDCEHEFLRLVADCACYTCSSGFTVAYLHHLFKHTPLLCQRLLILHNVFYASHLP